MSIGKICLLGEIIGNMSPGDVFYLLNHPVPQVVVLVTKDEVLTNDGRTVPGHWPIRIVGEWWKAFSIDTEAFLSDRAFLVDHVPFGKFPVGAIFLVIDDDLGIGYLKMVAEIDKKNKVLIMHDGSRIDFNSNSPLIIPTGAVFEPDFFDNQAE